MYKNIIIVILVMVYAITAYVSYGVLDVKDTPVKMVVTTPPTPTVVVSDALETAVTTVVDNTELTALAVTLYCEARGESQYGIAAVADTIRNRVKSPMFPNTYYAVVTQHRQFSCIHDTKNIMNNVKIGNAIDKRDFNIAVRVAKRTISGSMGKMTYNALFYHTNKINPFWANKYNKLGAIGHHIFYTTTKL